MNELRSYFVIIITLIKSFVGTGIIFLPGTFRVSGLMCGNVLSGVVCVLAILSLRMLIKCCNGNENLSDLGERVWGKTGLLLIDSSIFFSQLGFSTVYIIFIAHSIQEIIYSISSCQVEISILKLICVQMVIYLPFVFLRDIGNLSFPSVLANISVFSVLGVIIYYSNENIIRNPVGRPNVLDKGNIYGAGLVLGTSAFNFEGVALILPIRNSTPKSIIKRFPGIMTLTMLLIGLFSNLFASFVYYSFGEDTSSPVTENILNPKIKLISLMFYSIAITFSVPLQLYPSMKIAEKYLFFNKNSGLRKLETRFNVSKNVICCNNYERKTNTVSCLGESELIYSSVSDDEYEKHLKNDNNLVYLKKMPLGNLTFQSKSATLSNSIVVKNKMLMNSEIDLGGKDENIDNNGRSAKQGEADSSYNCLDSVKKVGNVEMVLIENSDAANNPETHARIESENTKFGFKKSVLKALLAYSLVLFCGTLAYGLEEELSSFVTIIGGLLCVPLAFVYPPIFYYKLNKSQICLTERIFLSFIIVLGSFVSIISITMAVLTWEITTRTIACIV